MLVRKYTNDIPRFSLLPSQLSVYSYLTFAVLCLLGDPSKQVDRLVIGGGMVFTFLKARGLSVGSSLVEDDKLDLVGTRATCGIRCNDVMIHSGFTCLGRDTPREEAERDKNG